MAFGLGLASEEYDRKYKDLDLITRVLSYFKDYKKSMLIVIFFLTITSISNSLTPIISREIIVNLVETQDWSFILFLLLVTFFLNTLGWIFNYYRQKNSSKVIGDVVLTLREDVNKSVLGHDLSFFDKYPTGKIVSRINTDSRDFGQTAELTMQVISSFLVVFIVLSAMFTINIPLTFSVLVMVPLVFIIALSFRKIARKRTLEGQRALATVNSFVQETISGIQIAKTFRQEKKLYNKFIGVNNQSYKANLRRAYVFNFIFPILNIVQGLALVLLIWLGGEGTLSGNVSAGDFYLFLQSLWLFFFPLFSIASFWPSFQAGLAASERIFALIDTPPVVIQNNSIPVDRINGEINIDNIDFSYNRGEDLTKKYETEDSKEEKVNKVFRNFSLKIKKGESLAIVGHTGAGKSSIAKLLARFYEFQKGSIIIDGIDIREYNLKDYRKQIGIIPQVPFLWADSLENNIRYGNPSATKEKIIWALNQAGGSDWVNDLPQGLDTNIRERGALLSMGQRQLVAFARTLLEDPAILILDEATASVDPFTETRIQEAIEKTIEGRTSIIIAHRLWTVRRCDRIIVLDQGKIVEEGNHEELMRFRGYYATLYDTYFRHQSFEYIIERPPAKASGFLVPRQHHSKNG